MDFYDNCSQSQSNWNDIEENVVRDWKALRKKDMWKHNQDLHPRFIFQQKIIILHFQK